MVDLPALLVSPWSVVDGERPSLAWPALIVVLPTLLSLVQVATLLSEMEPFGPLWIVFVLVSGIISAFTTWGVYTAVFYGLSELLGGTGGFRDLFAMTGWGFLPQLIPAALIITGAAPLSSLAGVGLTLALSLWSFVIWVAAVEQSRELSRRRAVATVLPPALLGGILFLIGIMSIGLS